MAIRTFILSAVAAGVLSTAAVAADLPSRRAPPVYVPPVPAAFSWTGFYVGGQVGYEFGRDHSIYDTTTTTSTAAPPFFALARGDGIIIPAGTTTTAFNRTNADTSPHGVAGGGHVGYLFSTQSLPGLGGLLGAGGVIGIEGDINGADYRSSSIYSGDTLVAGGVRSRIQGSVRGRLGIAFDRLLVYATGGAAFAQFDVRIPDSDGDSYTYKRDRVGYTVGGGVEYAFTNTLSARIEYRYSDYGTFTGDLAAPVTTATTTFTSTHHETVNLIQAGVSFRFASPAAPVVARY